MLIQDAAGLPRRHHFWALLAKLAKFFALRDTAATKHRSDQTYGAAYKLHQTSLTPSVISHMCSPRPMARYVQSLKRSVMSLHSHQIVGLDPGAQLLCPAWCHLQSHCCWWSRCWQTSHCPAAPAPPWQTRSMSAAEHTATGQLVSRVQPCICNQSSAAFLNRHKHSSFLANL